MFLNKNVFLHFDIKAMKQDSNQSLPFFPSGQEHFVDAHEAKLIQRVSNIEPILDELKGKIIQQEAYDKIRAQQTPQEKMRALYNGPLKAGDAAKEAFYQSLKKHEPTLIDDLR